MAVATKPSLSDEITDIGANVKLLVVLAEGDPDGVAGSGASLMAAGAVRGIVDRLRRSANSWQENRDQFTTAIPTLTTINGQPFRSAHLAIRVSASWLIERLWFETDRDGYEDAKAAWRSDTSQGKFPDCMLSRFNSAAIDSEWAKAKAIILNRFPPAESFAN